MPTTWFPDRADVDERHGPALIAHVVDGEPSMDETQWHHHTRGQFMYVHRGMAVVRTAGGVWIVLPQRIGWMPPGVEHTVRVIEPLTGWGVWVAPEATAGLPTIPAMLRGSELLHALVQRAAGWSRRSPLSDAQRRLMDVLLDELRQARIPETPIRLPMPSDRRLVRVAAALLNRPGDVRTRDEWASWAGISTRSLSRRFRDETGLSFVQWRQHARLTHALQQLGQGATVASVADALGYASVSAFVAMFRRAMGQSPGRYLSLDVR